MTHKMQQSEEPTEILTHQSFNPPTLSNCDFDNPNAIMATELTVQSERAFQKQPHIFLNSKSKTKSSRVGKGGRRWYKDVGLGFRTPKTAIEGSYIGMWKTQGT
jgi:small subunit ribosomal protein S11e